MPEFVCTHLCCVVPLDPTHQHLFDPSECLDCQRIEKEWERDRRRNNR